MGGFSSTRGVSQRGYGETTIFEVKRGEALQKANGRKTNFEGYSLPAKAYRQVTEVINSSCAEKALRRSRGGFEGIYRRSREANVPDRRPL